MNETTQMPLRVRKRAIDVTPHYHGIYCTVAGGEPHVNQIVLRRWSEDGKEIVFMLESHNFYFSEPEASMLVVELPEPVYADADWFQKAKQDDARLMASQPGGAP